MRLSLRITLFAFFMSVCFLSPTDYAMGGKGGGGGGRGGGGHGGRGGGNGHGHSHSHSHGGNVTKPHGQGGSHSHSHHTHKPKVNHQHQRTETIERAPKLDDVARDHQPWSMQRTNEERKLKHRMDVADKLDRLSEKNGNEHLKDTAERMREKAQDHYDKRLAKIDSKDPNTDPEDPSAPDDSEVSSPGDDSQSPINPPPPPGSTAPDGSLGSKLTGRENAYYRQVRNEKRKFSQRMEMAEQLRALGEQQSDPSLLAAADRLEQHGLDHFQQRMAAIRSFQDRHGLIVD